MDVLSAHTSKTSAVTSTSTMKILEAAVIIEEVYHKSHQFEEIMTDLPNILSRLYTLQQLHSDQCSHSTRLNVLEDVLLSSNKEVLSNQSVLDAMKTEMSDNIHTFESNMLQVRYDRIYCMVYIS